MDIRKGDTVHLRVTVDGVCGELVIFRCTDGTKVEGMKSHIVHVESRPLAVGDIVTFGNSRNHYRIICIDDGMAFLAPVNTAGHTVYAVSSLRRV